MEECDEFGHNVRRVMVHGAIDYEILKPYLCCRSKSSYCRWQQKPPVSIEFPDRENERKHTIEKDFGILSGPVESTRGGRLGSAMRDHESINQENSGNS